MQQSRLPTKITSGTVFDGPRSPASFSTAGKTKVWDDRDIFPAFADDREELVKPGSEESKLEQLNSSMESMKLPRGRLPSQTYLQGKDRLQILNRIFVGGLQETINEEDLRGLFGKYGELLEVQIKERGNEKIRGFAFVTFKRVKDAEVAIREGRGEALSLKDIKLNVQAAYRTLQQNKPGQGMPVGPCVPNFPGLNMMQGPSPGYSVVPVYSPYGYGYPAAVPYCTNPYYPQYPMPDMQARYSSMFPMPMPNMWNPMTLPAGFNPPPYNINTPSPPAAPPGSPTNRLDSRFSFSTDGRTSQSPSLSELELMYGYGSMQ